MYFFSRRRLRAMLSEIDKLLISQKRKDIVARLNSPDFEQSLPAEVELAILWLLSKTKDLIIETNFPGTSKTPDAYMKNLISGTPAVIEITTHSNSRISFEKPMVRTASAISEYASTVAKGFGNRLWYCFPYKRDNYINKHTRIPTATENYIISSTGKETIYSWIVAGEERSEYLEFHDGEIVVQIRCVASMRLPMTQRVWTTVPPETHSLTKNPLYDMLNSKHKQLRGIPSEIARVLFVVDAGSDLLLNIDDRGYSDWTNPKKASDIIENFLYRKKNIDVVIVLAARRERSYSFLNVPTGNQLHWLAHAFFRPEFQCDLSTLGELIKKLPAPKREGYQARSLGQQFYTSPMVHWHYNGWSFKTMSGSIELKFSAKYLFEILAGVNINKIMEKEKPSQVAMWYEKGYEIDNISFEDGGLDKDDDYIIVTLRPGNVKNKFK